MRFRIITVVCALHLLSAEAKTLAGAGYFASDPAIRNFLIMSGLGQKFRNQADMMYDLSGFRSVSDQGMGRRQAQALYHDLIELSADEFSRRYGIVLPPEVLRRVKRDHPSHEERQYMEKLFAVMQSMDRRACILKLLCEIGDDPKKFGRIGERINKYLRSIPPVTWNSVTYPYTQAHALGREEGTDACEEEYDSCSYNLKTVAKNLETFGKSNIKRPVQT